MGRKKALVGRKKALVSYATFCGYVYSPRAGSSPFGHLSDGLWEPSLKPPQNRSWMIWVLAGVGGDPGQSPEKKKMTKKGILGSRWRLGFREQSTGDLCRKMYGEARSWEGPGSPSCPASCFPAHTCASPIFHCTCSTGGLHTPELSSDSIAHPDKCSGQEKSLSSRGLRPGGVTQSWSRLPSSSRAHLGSRRLYTPHGEKQEAQVASKIFLPHQ